METPKKFGPRPANSIYPSTTPCPACGKSFEEGDYTTLVHIGPGDDPEEQERCREGRAYTAVAIEAHWTCVTGETE